MKWGVYIILCEDDSLYTGITTDVTRRFKEHISNKGAKYCRAHLPKKLIFFESGHSHSSAAKQESQIKKLKKLDKWTLIRSARNELDKSTRG